MDDRSKKGIGFEVIDDNFEDYPHPYALDDNDEMQDLIASGHPAFSVPPLDNEYSF